VFEKQDSQAGERVQLVIDAKNLVNRAHAELSSRKKELDKDAKKRVKEAINSLEKALGRVKPENVTADEAEKIAAAKSGLERTLADVGINI
jgi:DNA-binding transcriptional regulator GbsR (MarR family)